MSFAMTKIETSILSPKGLHETKRDQPATKTSKKRGSGFQYKRAKLQKIELNFSLSGGVALCHSRMIRPKDQPHRTAYCFCIFHAILLNDYSPHFWPWSSGFVLKDIFYSHPKYWNPESDPKMSSILRWEGIFLQFLLIKNPRGSKMILMERRF